MKERTVLAIDPGSAKCGFALVQRSLEGKIELLWRGIAPPDEIPAKLDEAKAVRDFNTVIVGAGTRSRPVVEIVRQHLPSMGVLLVDERDTSLQARERYWEYNPRRGWMRLFPATLFVPKEPVDDFAALVLAERVLDV